MGNASSKTKIGPGIRIQPDSEVILESIRISNTASPNFLIGRITILDFESEEAPLANLKWEKFDKGYIDLILDDQDCCWLKLINDSILTCEFKFNDDGTNNEELFFLNASSDQELERIFYEYIQDKNNLAYVHKVNLSNEKPNTWFWSWEPPGRKDLERRGWRNSAAFFKRKKNQNQFYKLISFKYWVEDLNNQMDTTPISPLNEPLYVTTPIPAQFLSETLPEEDCICTDISKKFSNPIASQDTHDGPLFRATLTGLEKKTSLLKKSVKQLVQSLKYLNISRQNLIESQRQLIEVIHELQPRSPNLSNTDIIQYLVNFISMEIRMSQQLYRTTTEILVEPLEKLYYNQIKIADLRRKTFDEASKDFYQFLSKYLSSRTDMKEKEKKQTEKYLSRKKAFDFERFQYYHFIFELNGGRKEKDILFQILEYAQLTTKLYSKLCAELFLIKPDLGDIAKHMEESKSEIEALRSQDREKHRLLKGIAFDINSNDLNDFKSNHFSPPWQALNEKAAPSISLAANKVIDQINDLEIKQDHKEGILFALSKPSIINDPVTLPKLWHKYWVVLSDGKLAEYDNWKASPDLHNNPINLKMASVREARSIDRKFCFEVITPHMKRIYQTTSEEELNDWITAIQNAVRRCFKLDTDIVNAQLLETMGNETKPLVEALGLKRNTTIKGQSSAEKASAYVEPQRSKEELFTLQNLVNMLHESDLSNSICADCASNEDVDWCATNFPVFLCIDCSGIHRSMGSHNSRIRSLTLDVNAFNPDLIELLKMSGNTLVNGIYEAKILDSKTSIKPNTKSSYDAKSQFIWSKYGEKSFVKPLDGSLEQALQRAIDQSNVELLIHCLASHAAPDMVDTDGVPMVLRALKASAIDQGKQVFPLAELLILNGAQILESFLEASLNKPAMEYLKKRLDKQKASVLILNDVHDPLENHVQSRGSKLVKKMSLRKGASYEQHN